MQEAFADTSRQPSRGVIVTAQRLTQVGDTSDQVRLTGGVHALDAKTTLPDGNDVQAAIGVAAGLADGSRGAHRGHLAGDGTDLSALTDEHDPERVTGLDAAAHHQPVAILEDVQGQRDAGTQDRAERKEGELDSRHG